MSLYCHIVAFKSCSTKASAFGFGFGRQCWLIRLGLDGVGNGGGSLRGETDGYGAFCRVLACLGVHAPAGVGVLVLRLVFAEIYVRRRLVCFQRGVVLLL